MQAIKAQARREMEAEKAAQEQQQRDAQALAGPKEVHLEAAPMLAIQGVLFHCPLIGKLSLKWGLIFTGGMRSNMGVVLL